MLIVFGFLLASAVFGIASVVGMKDWELAPERLLISILLLAIGLGLAVSWTVLP